MAKLTKRKKKILELFDSEKFYSLDDALILWQSYAQNCKAKFDESMELTMELGVDPRQTDQMVRGVVAMPHGLGKTIRVVVFTNEDKFAEAKDAGADIVGSEELIEEVKNGKLDFDICIASPDIMAKMASIAKILGPKGLMPNPKLGTVTPDVGAAVKRAKAGQVEYKVEKAGIVHAAIGKLSFSIEALKTNLLALYNAVIAAKPSASKGIYVRKVYVGSTQGPSIAIDLQKIIG